MQTLTLESLLIRDPDMFSTDMDGDTVMISIERGEYLGIGGVGTRAWELLEQPTSIRELVHRICLEFDVDEATCQADMLVFANELITNGMARTC